MCGGLEIVPKSKDNITKLWQMITINFLIKFRTRMCTIPILSLVTLYSWSGIWVFNSSITVRRASCTSLLCWPTPLPQGSSRRIWNIPLAHWGRLWMAGLFLKAFKVLIGLCDVRGLLFLSSPVRWRQNCAIDYYRCSALSDTLLGSLWAQI